MLSFFSSVDGDCIRFWITPGVAQRDMVTWIFQVESTISKELIEHTSFQSFMPLHSIGGTSLPIFVLYSWSHFIILSVNYFKMNSVVMTH